MTRDAHIGNAVLRAFRFLKEIHKDAHAVAQAIDALMGNEGWYPTERTWSLARD